MKKFFLYRLSACLIIWFISIISSSVYAKDIKKDTIKTDEIIVTASRVPMLYSEIGRFVQTLSKSEITIAPVHSIQELLKNSTNIDVRQRGSIGV
ncbi:MAG: hypothetical protein A2X61_01380 [Ignavibacteria bacterium GWB2_35_12]|nr:MAG: hypothetical protein A2X63_05690 [Ignavibacteria bacterium GWA2_35_8]OGU41828.1 MAG: hypothetical protein A2X61_01380 [Ignavibacteria bacterium GWB2_35_12]OGU95429.1 MAG: hypothetical protein A2220_17200 [Ignavibacteria bacterium RIFOXYA2_FULL_35_10]OGV23525.1 MAG: hypothetical protein A2475_06260 [Ignavibacteria bacterium RIFOXYC2_FULL_35_21]